MAAVRICCHPLFSVKIKAFEYSELQFGRQLVYGCGTSLLRNFNNINSIEIGQSASLFG
jgi:hypothetical protein